MFPGWMQIALVVLLIVLLFGRGKISSLMGDVAKGITSFRKGLKDGVDDDPDAPKQVSDNATMANNSTIEGEAREKEPESSAKDG